MYASVNNPQENDVDEFTEYLKIPKLTDADRDRIEGPLSYEECKKALDTFQNNKAPGEDGSWLYQDLERGGIRMVDIDIMFKALKLAWIPRLLTPGNQNWKTVPDYYLRKFGGLNFLLRCNYDAKYIKSIPLFYRNIPVYFNELKTI